MTAAFAAREAIAESAGLAPDEVLPDELVDLALDLARRGFRPGDRLTERDHARVAVERVRSLGRAWTGRSPDD